MTLKQRILESVKDAMRAQDKARLGALRLITAGIKQREVDEKIELNDEQVLSLLNKMLKQRRDAAQQYTDANRPELADKENFEISVIQEFLPEQLSEEEVNAIVQTAISETGASSMQDMGKVMGIVKGKTAGRADMAVVSKLVKDALNK